MAASLAFTAHLVRWQAIELCFLINVDSNFVQFVTTLLLSQQISVGLGAKHEARDGGCDRQTDAWMVEAMIPSQQMTMRSPDVKLGTKEMNPDLGS